MDSTYFDFVSRTRRLTGASGVERLRRSCVAVFGLGGVGSYTAEALARCGVGRLILIDGDTVEVSNINRQLCALHSTIGRSKAEVMAQRIHDISPDCTVEPHTLFYGAEDGHGLIQGCDYVADAIDTVSSKLLLAEECAAAQVPLISAMGCGNKWDPTGFRVADISETRVCPLCRVMRRELKARGIAHLPVVYSEEAPAALHREPDEPDTRKVAPGSLAFVVGTAGLLMASHIIRSLLKEEA